MKATVLEFLNSDTCMYPSMKFTLSNEDCMEGAQIQSFSISPPHSSVIFNSLNKVLNNKATILPYD